MRFNLKNLLQGVVYTTPIVLLALSACGGGGGSSSAPIPTYNVSVAASGVVGTGLVLRNNGGDDLPVASGVTNINFATPIASGKSYNVTVLSYPATPGPQLCTITPPSSGTVIGPVTVGVSCSTAYTVSASIPSNLTGTGLVLQDNLGDNLLVSPTSANHPVTFNTPLANGANYTVTILTQPRNQYCSVNGGLSGGGTISSAPVSVSISCAAASAPTADPYVYAVNSGSSGVGGISVYTSSLGVMSPQSPSTATTGSSPSAIAIDAGKFAYVANSASNSLSGFLIASGVLNTLTDVDAGTPGNQTSIATGTTPHAVVVHPSGKFVYVANYGSGAGTGSISAYSIDPLTGALAAIDADQAAGNQLTIATQIGPQSLAIDATGAFLYAANAISNTVSAYGTNQTTGALTLIGSIATGTTPYSIAMNPAGSYLYVANLGSSDITGYTINGNGSLTNSLMQGGTVPTGAGPHSIVVDSTGTYAYVVATNDPGSAQVWTYSITGGVLYFDSSVAAGSSPFSITLDSTGNYAYVANLGSNDISVFGVSGVTLTPVVCNTVCGGATNTDFLAGAGPIAIATSR